MERESAATLGAPKGPGFERLRRLWQRSAVSPDACMQRIAHTIAVKTMLEDVSASLWRKHDGGPVPSNIAVFSRLY